LNGPVPNWCQLGQNLSGDVHQCYYATKESTDEHPQTSSMGNGWIGALTRNTSPLNCPSLKFQ